MVTNKHRLSISVDEETLLLLLDYIRKSAGKYRNKSHVVESAIHSLIKGDNHG